MNNNTILALVFLMAGTLLTTAAVTIVPAAYAEDDHDNNRDGNKIKADESLVAVADCDYKNIEVERAGFDCVAIEEDGFLGIPMR
jgi:hypothetical protein